MKKIKKIKVSLPGIKKDIKNFLLSEEGKVSKNNMIKIGMGLAVLGSMMGLSSSTASADHSSAFFNNPDRGGHASHGSHGSHGSHSSHGSHGSHGSHSSHGSHGSHGSHSSHGSHGSHGQW
ncbi:MAG: His-Xaa-Ser repeat protein HxsA4 [Candidatus Omnitrophota bacterium]